MTEIHLNILSNILLQSYQWNDQRCDNTPEGYACKTKQVPVLERQTEAPLIGCPSQNKYDRINDGACYKFVKGTSPKTWAEARSMCQSYGGELVDIWSRFEQMIEMYLVYSHCRCMFIATNKLLLPMA